MGKLESYRHSIRVKIVSAPKRVREAASQRPAGTAYLYVESLVAWIGTGLYLTGSIFFFTRFVGLSPEQVGAGLTAAGIAGLAVNALAGRVIDATDARSVAMIAGIARAGMAILLIYAGSFIAFILLVTLLSISNRVREIAIGKLVANLAVGQNRVGVSAFIHTFSNTGFLIGAVLCGVTLGFDSSIAYCLMMLAYAATAVISVLSISKVPKSERHSVTKYSPNERTQSAIRDLPYLTIAMLCGVLMISDTVLTAGLPLLISNNQSIPSSVAPSLVALNTVLVIAFQVRASRNVGGAQTSQRRIRQAGFTGAIACVLCGGAAMGTSVVAVAFLFAGVIVLTVGELLQTPTSWDLRYRLAPESKQGEYGGMFQLASGIPQAIAPGLLTLLITQTTFWAWVVLAGLHVVLIMLAGPCIAWVEATRSQIRHPQGAVTIHGLESRS
ncbi:MFS transporter [Microbispora sp. CA-102843]|uniref:MFS transporter n=1 Tax=Microbispora sp. CA-102843 TaxID=3239952 RepID=UPI003D92BF10